MLINPKYIPALMGIVLFIAAIFVASIANSQQRLPCISLEEYNAQIESKEIQVATALTPAGNVLEVYVDDDDIWTVWVIFAQEKSACMSAFGKQWRNLPNPTGRKS